MESKLNKIRDCNHNFGTRQSQNVADDTAVAPIMMVVVLGGGLQPDSAPTIEIMLQQQTNTLTWPQCWRSCPEEIFMNS